LKIGKVSSLVGDEAVVSMHITRKPLDLNEARKLIGKTVSLEDDRNAKPLGRITNVIGKTDEPYATVSLNLKNPSAKPGDIIGKPVFSNVNIKI
jgi:rRNA processing protein Gar1